MISTRTRNFLKCLIILLRIASLYQMGFSVERRNWDVSVDVALFRGLRGPSTLVSRVGGVEPIFSPITFAANRSQYCIVIISKDDTLTDLGCLHP